MFRSISWRIATVFTILILVCIGMLSAYLLFSVKENYLDSLRMQLINQARVIEDISRTYITGKHLDDIDALAKRLGEEANARVTIIDSNGVVLGDSEQNPAMMDNHADRPEVVEALSHGTGSSIRRSTTLGYNMIYVAVPITIDGKITGTIRLSLPLVEIDKWLEHINRAIISGALVAAAIAVLLALQISKTVTVPIKRLAKMSLKIAGGEFHQEIQVVSSDEVGELGKAFNQMAAKIKDMVALITDERDKMAVILSHMGDGIIVVDNDRIITMVNKAAEMMFKCSNEMALGHTFIEVVRDYELDEILQRCLKSRQQQVGVVETKLKQQFLGVVATPIEDATGCVLLFQDLTELRKLETVRQDLVSNVSHELRTPIASIKAIAETLKEGAIHDPSVATDFLEKIDAEVDRLAHMVQELGELSRIESGGISLEKRPLDIAEVIEQVAKRLKAQSDRAGLTLSITVSPNLPQALADKEQTEQAITNLIHNAIKFTPPGGAINVSAKAEGENILISVADNGVGIPADELPRIFERFYKADKARTSSGSGLGLAIAKHAIEAQGGRIWAESTERKGSTFTFTLPKIDKA